MNIKPNQLLSIQYLRAIAALMVVLHHARNPQSWLFNPLDDYVGLAWGVDIFFVISGFIMYVAARNEHYVDFVGKRIIRVVPLYWIATLLFFALNTKFQPWLVDVDTLKHLGQSLFFIPHYSLNSSEKMWPYLIPGWTLNYEMFFYLIFFFGLVIKRTILLTTSLIVSLFIIGLFIESESAVVKTFTRPILLEFLCGVWVAYAYTKGLLNKYAWLLLGSGFLIILLQPFAANDMPTIIGRIIGSTMIIAGAASLGDKTPQNKTLQLLGDASYSIYLTHTFLSLRLSSKIWSQVPLEGWLQFSGWVVLSLLVSSIVGVLVHLYFEKPMIKWIRYKWSQLSVHKNVINRGSEST